MAKHTRHDILFSQKALSFIDFWEFISAQVGDYRLDINSSAQNLDELFTKDSVHPEHLKELIRNSAPQTGNSAKNKHLTQAIDLTKLLDALGECAFALRQNAADDLFDIELLEEIAWHISERFKHLVTLPINTECSQTEAHSARVVSIKDYRTNTIR